MTIHLPKLTRELSDMMKHAAATEDEREMKLALELILRAARELDPERLPPDLARQAVAFVSGVTTDA